MVFQAYNLFPHLTVMENIVLGMTKAHGVARDEAEERGEVAAGALRPRRPRRTTAPTASPAASSSGSRSCAPSPRRPRALLLDEVTSALDPELVGDVLEVVRELKGEGVTMLLVTHEMSFAREVADRVGFLHDGRIVEIGAARPGSRLAGAPRDEAVPSAAAGRRAPMRRGAVVIAVAIAVLAVGCGDDSSSGNDADALRGYLARVEPVRLGVNDLLDRVDPITEAYAEGELGPDQAQRRLEAVERRFAAYMVQLGAIEDVPDQVREVHDAYAYTYVYEDSYLVALAAAIPERDFEDLPNTEDRQREAIIAWRTRLQVVADELGVELPADLQIAGRGEIRPEPTGD